MPLAKKGRSALDHIDMAVQVICVVLAASIVVAVVGQVVARYVTSDSTPWLAELATYAFVWLTLLSIALGVRRGRHMSLDIWEYISTPRWLDRSIEAVVALIIIAVLAVLAWYGLEALPAASGRITPGLGIPFAFVSAAVPVGCLLSIVFQIELFALELRTDRDRGEKVTLGRTLMEEQSATAESEGVMS